MQTLVAPEAYDDRGKALTWALPLLSALQSLIESGFRDHSAGRTIFSVVLGAFFGFIGAWLLRGAIWTFNDRLHRGDPRVVRPPPEGPYRYRLPCSWERTPGVMVRGILYLGPGGLRFDPHLRNWERFRESLVMEPLHDTHVNLVDADAPWWLWMVGKRSVCRLQVRWNGGQARFSVPAPAHVTELLRERIAEMSLEPASRGGAMAM